MNIFINLSVIFWSLFPALISYTQPASSPLKVELRQLVANSDLLIAKASPNENQPLGFTMTNLTPISLTNGVLKYQAKALYASIYPTNHATLFNTNDTYYTYVRCKITDHDTSKWSEKVFITSSPNFQFVSAIGRPSNTVNTVRLTDYRTSGWTPIEIDYMGAINITDLVSRGILPSGLTDAEYKSLLDTILAEIGGTFQGSYFYTETISDNYKWFSTGFVEKTGERDFIDYLGFFVWLVVPYLAGFLVYKLLKGVLHG